MADSVIYSNFNLDGTYFAGGSPVAGASTDLGYISSAMGFVPNDTFQLTQITVGVQWFSQVSPTNSVTFSLTTNNGGIPGAVLGIWTFTNLPVFGTTDSIVQTMVFAPGIVLQKNQLYWLWATPTTPNAAAVWGDNNVGMLGPAVQQFAGGRWNGIGAIVSNSAFEARGTLIPEPSTLLLVGTGFLGMLAVARRSPRHPKAVASRDAYRPS